MNKENFKMYSVELQKQFINNYISEKYSHVSTSFEYSSTGRYSYSKSNGIVQLYHWKNSKKFIRSTQFKNNDFNLEKIEEKAKIVFDDLNKIINNKQIAENLENKRMNKLEKDFGKENVSKDYRRSNYNQNQFYYVYKVKYNGLYCTANFDNSTNYTLSVTIDKLNTEQLDAINEILKLVATA